MKLRLKTATFYDSARGERYEGPGEFDIDDPVAEEYAERAVWSVVDEPTDTSDADENGDSDDTWSGGVEHDATTTNDALDTAIEETIEIEAVNDETEPVEPESDEAPDVDLHAFLTANVAPIGNQIKKGKFDDDLETLKNIERQTKERKTVIRDIEARQEELDG